MSPAQSCEQCARFKERLGEGLVWCYAYRQARAEPQTPCFFYVPMAGHPRPEVSSAVCAALETDIKARHLRRQKINRAWLAKQAELRAQRALICRALPVAPRLVDLYARIGREGLK